MELNLHNTCNRKKTLAMHEVVVVEVPRSPPTIHYFTVGTPAPTSGLMNHVVGDIANYTHLRLVAD